MIFIPRLALPVLCVVCGAVQAATVAGLQCEYMAEPAGVEAEQPRFGWRMESDARGARQTAYQVVVDGAWDSGRVESDQTIGIVYGGAPLAPGRRYTWKVQLWDEAGQPSGWSAPAQFGTGWKDWRATWIGTGAAPEGDALGLAIETRGPDEVRTVDIDLGAVAALDEIVLRPQRHNDPESGGWRDGYAFPLRFRVEASETPDFATAIAIADQTAADFPNPGLEPVAFPAGGRRARYVRLVVTKFWPRGGNLPHVMTLAELEARSGGTNLALGKSVACATSTECCGWGRAHLTDGQYSRPQPAALREHPHAAILLRKELAIEKPVRRATAYVSGLGWSELSVDGKKVGDAVLSPQFTDYDESVPYEVRDLTAALVPGAHAIGVTLGNGFAATPELGYLRWYGNAGPPRLLFQLELEFADGERSSVCSDESWKWATGEITFNDLWVGERVDHRLARPGWDRPGYDDRAWRAAAPAPVPKGRLFARTMAPVRVLETAVPARVEADRFLFNEVGSGWLRLKTAGEAGDVVKVHYINEAAGHSHFGRALATEFTLKGGGPEVFEPKFLFHTIDPVVRVEGLRGAPSTDTLIRCSVGIDLPRAGRFACSDPFLSRMYEALLRTQRNYNFDYPMDPTREKAGWTQDVMTMIDTSPYDFDVAAFYWNWWQDMRDNQRPDGYLGSVVPLYDRVLNDCNCVWWSGMVIYTPWKLYQYYGDPRFLAESYPAMVSYMNWLATKADADRVISWGLGDWLEVGTGSAPKRTAVAITSTCGYYLYATILHQSAVVLRKAEDAARYAALADAIKDGFNRRFLNAETGQVGANADSQTAQILPLCLDLIPAAQRPRVIERLVANIHERKDHLSTGFIGTLHLLLGLPELGEGELAHRIVMQQDFPGWNTLVRDGVQMETWAGGQVQMPSLGGPIGAYFYQVLAGVRPDPAGPGFKKFIIKPSIVGDLTWVEAAYDSPRGRIESAWKREGERVELNVTIPPNTTATVWVPGADPAKVPAPARVLRTEGGCVVVEAAAGQYRFEGRRR